MDKPAVFQATYADFKLIKTRRCVQFVFEVPLEKEREASEVVGGMPNPGEERWFAIARLNDGSVRTEPKDAPDETTSGELVRGTVSLPRPSRSWHDMSPAQQAGLLSNEEAFGRFMYENGLRDFDENCGQAIRQFCEVASRSDIKPGTEAETRWRDLVGQYRAWMKAPECV